MPQPPCQDAELYLAVLEHLPDGVIVVDQAGGLLFSNAATESLLPGGGASLCDSGPAPRYQVLDRYHCPLTAVERP
jgi:PAS domain-containing protein